MGSCLAKNNKKSNFSLTPVSKFSTNPSILKQITTPTGTKFIQTKICEQLSEIRSYDATNPHRQFNVKINGVNFEVINSIEDELLFKQQKTEQTQQAITN